MIVLNKTFLLLLSSAPLAAALAASSGDGGIKGGAAKSGSPSLAEPAVSYLAQGWSPSKRDAFHYATQGSELIPYFWFLNLVEPDGVTLLKDDLRRFGALYDKASPKPNPHNRDGLPIGFARQGERGSFDGMTERHWLGLTCAACHTGAIVPKPDSGALRQGMILIDGAPAKIDVAAFLTRLRESVKATDADPTRLEVLAQKVAKAGDGKKAEVIARFHKYTKHIDEILDLYLPQNSGSGRLDCFGAIMNRVCVYDIKGKEGRPAKLDAPVDFPFIWYTDRQDKIQWFGGLSNGDWLARLSRNAGEVSGVFGHVDVRKGASLDGFRSSLDVAGLGWIDWQVNLLKSPRWTDVFPAPDSMAVKRGRQVFVASCQTGGCHGDLAPKGQVATVSPTPLGPDLNTDPNNTLLVNATIAQSGRLKGDPMFLIPGSPKIGERAPAALLVGTVVAGELLHKQIAVLVAYATYLWREEGGDKASAMKKAQAAFAKKSLAGAYAGKGRADTAPIVGYESRSLNGIWATAPYLHNGSVPNMIELLWPERRESTFYVGSFVYDPTTMGYASDAIAGGTFFDTRLPGNSNGGHRYGETLPDADKYDLIAYLKTL